MLDIDIMNNDELDDFTTYMWYCAAQENNVKLALYWIDVYDDNCNVYHKPDDEVWAERNMRGC